MDTSTKLNLLNQYVSGKPRQVVEHYLLLGTEDAYQRARSLLHERYGNCNVISTSFLDKLEKWPKIGIKDSLSLREFSDFLNKVVAAQKTIKSLALLDFARENVKLVSKLPYQVENNWRDVIERHRAAQGEQSFPSFSRFAEFIKEAADRANIPELDELPKFRNPSNRPKKSQGANSFATSINSQSSCVEGKGADSCLFCQKTHDLNSCEEFKKKSYKDRKKFFFAKRLCLGCASSSEHQYKDCNVKKSCAVCSELHPTFILGQESICRSLTLCQCLPPFGTRWWNRAFHDCTCLG